ncbi:MAG: hypothetical protein CBD22_003370, partial [Rhizobiales bacterium TMED162]
MRLCLPQAAMATAMARASVAHLPKPNRPSHNMKNKMANMKRPQMTESASEHSRDADPVSDLEPDSPAPSLGGDMLTLDIDMRCTDWQGDVATLEAQAKFVWAHLAMPAAEISLVLAQGDFLASLNVQYRDKQGPTNVLSFPAQDFTTIA